MSRMQLGPVIENGQCRCCGATKRCRLLTVEYEWKGQTEIYINMFIDCFGFLLSHLDKIEKSLICTTCVSRLRDAKEFREQTLTCDLELREAMMRGEDEDALEQEKRFKIVIAELESHSPVEPYSSDEELVDIENFSADDNDDGGPKLLAQPEVLPIPNPKNIDKEESTHVFSAQPEVPPTPNPKNIDKEESTHVFSAQPEVPPTPNPKNIDKEESTHVFSAQPEVPPTPNPKNIDKEESTHVFSAQPEVPPTPNPKNIDKEESTHVFSAQSEVPPSPNPKNIDKEESGHVFSAQPKVPPSPNPKNIDNFLCLIENAPHVFFAPEIPSRSEANMDDREYIPTFKRSILADKTKTGDNTIIIVENVKPRIRHGVGDRYKCFLCNIPFTTADILTKHMKQMHFIKKRTYSDSD